MVYADLFEVSNYYFSLKLHKKEVDASLLHRLLFIRNYIYFISCSKSSNISLSKKYLKDIPNPSHNFFMDTTPGFILFSFNILYNVEGVTPERFASALMAMFLSSHNCNIRFDIASFVFNHVPTFCDISFINILPHSTIFRIRYIANLTKVCYNIRYIVIIVSQTLILL